MIPAGPGEASILGTWLSNHGIAGTVVFRCSYGDLKLPHSPAIPLRYSSVRIQSQRRWPVSSLKTSEKDTI